MRLLLVTVLAISRLAAAAPTPREIFETLTTGWVSVKDHTPEQLAPFLGGRAIVLLNLGEDATGPRLVEGSLHWQAPSSGSRPSPLLRRRGMGLQFYLILPHGQYLVLNQGSHSIEDLRALPPRELYEHSDWNGIRGGRGMSDDVGRRVLEGRFMLYPRASQLVGRLLIDDSANLDLLATDAAVRAKAIGRHAAIRIRVGGGEVGLGLRPVVIEGELLSVEAKNFGFLPGTEDPVNAGYEYRARTLLGEVIRLRDLPKQRSVNFTISDVVDVRFRRTKEELAEAVVETWGPDGVPHGSEVLEHELSFRTVEDLEYLAAQWAGKLHSQLQARIDWVINTAYLPMRREYEACHGKVSGDSPPGQ